MSTYCLLVFSEKPSSNVASFPRQCPRNPRQVCYFALCTYISILLVDTIKLRGLEPLLQLRYISSHAICNYLASRYSNSGRLLPKDPGGRAVLEQQMCFNGGVLYPRYRAAIVSIQLLYTYSSRDCNLLLAQPFSGRPQFVIMQKKQVTQQTSLISFPFWLMIMVTT